MSDSYYLLLINHNVKKTVWTTDRQAALDLSCYSVGVLPVLQHTVQSEFLSSRILRVNLSETCLSKVESCAIESHWSFQTGSPCWCSGGRWCLFSGVCQQCVSGTCLGGEGGCLLHQACPLHTASWNWQIHKYKDTPLLFWLYFSPCDFPLHMKIFYLM